MTCPGVHVPLQLTHDQAEGCHMLQHGVTFFSTHYPDQARWVVWHGLKTLRRVGGECGLYGHAARFAMVVRMSGGDGWVWLAWGLPTTRASSAILRIQVPDCSTAYKLLRSRGAEFITPPFDWREETRAFFLDSDGHLPSDLGGARSLSGTGPSCLGRRRAWAAQTSVCSTAYRMAALRPCTLILW